MKILFCTDGSEISFNALKNFANIQPNAEVDIFCSVDYSFLPDTYALEIATFENTCSQIASDIIINAKETAEDAGLKFGKSIKYCGETVAGILDTAKFGNYDLILMGSNGKKGVQRWLGSVSRDVINHSETSVYISRHKNEGKKILFATDGSSNSKLALKEAIKFLDLKDKDIYACIVLENPNLLFLEGTIDTNWLMKINELQRKYANDILEEFNETLKQYELCVKEEESLDGTPAVKIEDFAKEKGIDLIILGTRKGKKGFLQTSVSKRVTELTESDVIIFR